MLSCSNLVKKSAAFIQSTLMVRELLMYSVTKQQPVVDGQCSRRDWMDLLISTGAGLTTKMALVTLMASFGSGWTRYTA